MITDGRIIRPATIDRPYPSIPTKGSRGRSHGHPEEPRYDSSRPPQAPAGRMCEVPGCVTQLSVYNQKTRCWAHRGLEPFDGPGSPRAGHSQAA